MSHKGHKNILVLSNVNKEITVNVLRQIVITLSQSKMRKSKAVTPLYRTAPMLCCLELVNVLVTAVEMV